MEATEEAVPEDPLLVADFQGYRITPDGLISVLDAIRYVNGSTGEAVHMIRSRCTTLDIVVEFHQFPGEAPYPKHV